MTMIPAARNTKETPLTEAVSESMTDGQGQWCKCGKCGKVAPATPWDDFYAAKTEKGYQGGTLYCESCWWSLMRTKHSLERHPRNVSPGTN